MSFPIFTASGFVGPIRETIWTHDLKPFLGHASRAQTLVLAVFMGRDGARRLARAARQLIVECGHMHPRLFQHIVSAAVLGELASGSKEAARELMRDYESLLERESLQPLLIRLLKAHSLDKGGRI